MEGSSPADAAQLRRRGLLWLVVGFAVCPCHLPFTLLAVGTVLGGSALGATIIGNPLAVGVALGTLTALAYIKGLRLLRAADGCATGACDTASESALLVGIPRHRGG
jgi:hypothetical protein